MSGDPGDRLTIRVASTDEVATILALWRGSGAVVSATDDPDGVQALLDRDPEAMLVAVEATVIVGTLIVGWDGWRAALYRLVVAPEWRRRGIGTSLVHAAEERLVELGARRIGAVVIAEHDQAVAFWSALGYVADARVDRFMKNL